MKRPQGFDPQPDPAAASRTSTSRRPEKKRVAKAPKVPQAPKAPKAPKATAASASGRSSASVASDAPVPRQLRAARRERRRVEKREVRRFTKRTRTQRAAWLSVVGVIVALGCLLAVAVFSPLLSFERLEVRGAEQVDEAAVRDVIEDQLGTPLALLDYDAIREGLARIPLIRSFATEVTPPNTLTIHLVEREPIGVVRAESGFAVVDPAGVVLDRIAEQPDGLPRINVDDEGAAGVGFSAVVEVLLALPEGLRSDVASATATTRDDVRLTLSSGGEHVVWGSADRSELKARVLATLLEARSSGSTVEFDVSAPLTPVVRSR